MNLMEMPIDLGNIESEQLLIGAVLLNNDALTQAVDLRPEHFSHADHAQVYAEILRLNALGIVADVVSVKDGLKAMQLGNYLNGLMSGAVIVLNVEYHAHIVMQSHLRRNLRFILQDAIARMESGEQITAEELAGNVLAETEKLISASAAKGFQDDYQTGVNILNDLTDGRPPVSTGIAKLDGAMGGGLYAGKSYGFAARKKVGKTILAGSISYALNRAGIRHLFICGEMSPEEIQQRNLAREMNVNPFCFRGDQGRLQSFQSRVAETVASAKRNIIYRNAPGLTFESLQQIVSVALSKHKIKGFILDYWQLVGGKRKGQSNAEHLDDVAQWIANFSRKHGLWSITMAQINQEGNTRGGEGIRLAFDQVYQIHRDDLGQPHAWLEMMDSRYTGWSDIGDKYTPGLNLQGNGPYFEQAT